MINFEDQYPGPWRTNGRAYVYWVVEPNVFNKQTKVTN